MYNTDDSHSEIRLSTVNKIINDCFKYNKDFIVDLSIFNSAAVYKKLPSRDGGECGGGVG